MQLDALIARLQQVRERAGSSLPVSTAWHGSVAEVRLDAEHGSVTIYGCEELPDPPMEGPCVLTLGSPACGVDVSKFAGECDKTFKTCCDRFDNGVRFSGSPKIPKR